MDNPFELLLKSYLTIQASPSPQEPQSTAIRDASQLVSIQGATQEMEFRAQTMAIAKAKSDREEEERQAIKDALKAQIAGDTVTLRWAAEQGASPFALINRGWEAYGKYVPRVPSQGMDPEVAMDFPRRAAESIQLIAKNPEMQEAVDSLTKLETRPIGQVWDTASTLAGDSELKPYLAMPVKALVETIQSGDPKAKEVLTQLGAFQDPEFKVYLGRFGKEIRNGEIISKDEVDTQWATVTQGMSDSDRGLVESKYNRNDIHSFVKAIPGADTGSYNPAVAGALHSMGGAKTPEITLAILKSPAMPRNPELAENITREIYNKSSDIKPEEVDMKVRELTEEFKDLGPEGIRAFEKVRRVLPGNELRDAVEVARLAGPMLVARDKGMVPFTIGESGVEDAIRALDGNRSPALARVMTDMMFLAAKGEENGMPMAFDQGFVNEAQAALADPEAYRMWRTNLGANLKVLVDPKGERVVTMPRSFTETRDTAQRDGLNKLNAYEDANAINDHGYDALIGATIELGPIQEAMRGGGVEAAFEYLRKNAPATESLDAGTPRSFYRAVNATSSTVGGAYVDLVMGARVNPEDIAGISDALAFKMSDAGHGNIDPEIHRLLISGAMDVVKTVRDALPVSGRVDNAGLNQVVRSLEQKGIDQDVALRVIDKIRSRATGLDVDPYNPVLVKAGVDSSLVQTLATADGSSWEALTDSDKREAVAYASQAFQEAYESFPASIDPRAREKLAEMQTLITFAGEYFPAKGNTVGDVSKRQAEMSEYIRKIPLYAELFSLDLERESWFKGILTGVRGLGQKSLERGLSPDGVNQEVRSFTPAEVVLDKLQTSLDRIRERGVSDTFAFEGGTSKVTTFLRSRKPSPPVITEQPE